MPSTLRTVFSGRMLVTVLTGFSSGLPLLLTGSTLQAWLVDAKVDLTSIGLFALVGLPYTLKFLWAPLLDRFVPPYLGRRRGWMLSVQLVLVLAIAGLGLADPTTHPWHIAALALLLAFMSATQDIVLDAYRRELLPEAELGLGSSLFVNGYRVAMLASGAMALFLADLLPWHSVYLIMAGFMGVGIVTTLLAPEPQVDAPPPRTLREAVVEPFVDFFRRPGALTILSFILLYKIGDQMASSMTTPFVLGLGFSKTQLAAVVKTFGMAATIGGGFAGGLLMLRMGIRRALWLFGIAQASAILGYAGLAQLGPVTWGLALAITLEMLTAGMGTSAYVAYMASLTNKRFTATQYALFSSLMGIPRVFAAAPTGWIAAHLGWSGYFVFCTLAAIPGLALLRLVLPADDQPDDTRTTTGQPG
ncbi:MAG: AmpG family muropeptide MFS transporter [Pseudomonadota bacterium]